MDANGYSPPSLTFDDNHVDYAKIAALRAGQEVRFRYEPLDGDPKLTSGGDMPMKYLRLE